MQSGCKGEKVFQKNLFYFLSRFVPLS